METKAIVTMAPYAPHMDEVLKHERVSGIRLNTVMPKRESEKDLLERLNDKVRKFNKELWVDLKCRQLRVKNFGVPPFTEIELTHEIEANTPCRAYFGDRLRSANVLEVNGNKLIMQEGPKRVIGPGESVNIPDAGLKVKGYLTDSDKRYIEAGNTAGIMHYMLSFVEDICDIEEFRKYNKDAEIVEKIESQSGLEYVMKDWKNKGRLMAACGDLFIELRWPHKILDALELILEKDANAIAASRILESLSEMPEPSCQDIGYVDNLLRMGYKTVMLGDEVCLERKSIIPALNVLDEIAQRYENSRRFEKCYWN